MPRTAGQGSDEFFAHELPRQWAIALRAVCVIMLCAAAMSSRAAAGIGGGAGIGDEKACAESWLASFGAEPGADGAVHVMIVHDDGTGPMLYIGGEFTRVGGRDMLYLARWNGNEWMSVGLGPNGPVHAMGIVQDVLGPRLVIGGAFSFAGSQPAANIAQWDGLAWSRLDLGLTHEGGNAVVQDLLVHDDGLGEGPVLFAAGCFTSAGGAPALHVARWNGWQWSAVGAGMTGSGGETQVRALAAAHTGEGPRLYAGGEFLEAGGRAAAHIAQWDGAAWSALGRGVNASVHAMQFFDSGDDGAGESAVLHVGGAFTQAGDQPAGALATWDGRSWESVGSGAGGVDQPLVAGLTVLDERGESLLVVCGDFTTMNGASASRVARFDGQSWVAFSGGIDGPVAQTLSFEPVAGEGAVLIAAGAFVKCGDVQVNALARLDGSSWVGIGSGATAPVYAAVVPQQDISGAVVIGGVFASIGGLAAHHVARWDGDAWHALGSGVGGPVRALAYFDDGSGEALHVAGAFTDAGGAPASNIARWNGTAWSPLGAGLDGEVFALAVFDDGVTPALYAGGSFLNAGGQPALRIARWDGVQWSAVGDGLDDSVHALHAHHGTHGPALIVGGAFTSAGALPAAHIAQWDGATWSAMDSGFNNDVYALTVHHGGTCDGAQVVAAGRFTTAGGRSVRRVARWDGGQWLPFGAGLGGAGTAAAVFAVESAVFERGGGSVLMAGGSFINSAGVTVTRLARWDGEQWQEMGGGANDTVHALTALRTEDIDDDARLLLVGGDFFGSPAGDSYVAALRMCPPPAQPVGDVNGDGTLSFEDLLALLSFWGPCDGGPAELDGDGEVGFPDLLLFIQLWMEWNS